MHTLITRGLPDIVEVYSWYHNYNASYTEVGENGGMGVPIEASTRRVFKETPEHSSERGD